MNRLLHVVTIVAMAVHALGGCCVHHAHAESLSPDASATIETACPCEYHGHSGQDEPAENPGDHGGCDEGPCTFLRPDAPTANELLTGLGGLPPISSWLTSPRPSRLAAASIVLDRAGPLIPRHLLLQVLLI